MNFSLLLFSARTHPSGLFFNISLGLNLLIILVMKASHHCLLSNFSLSILFCNLLLNTDCGCVAWKWSTSAHGKPSPKDTPDQGNVLFRITWAYKRDLNYKLWMTRVADSALCARVEFLCLSPRTGQYQLTMTGISLGKLHKMQWRYFFPVHVRAIMANINSHLVTQKATKLRKIRTVSSLRFFPLGTALLILKLIFTC